MALSMTDKQREALYQSILNMADAYLAILDPTAESNFVTDFASIRANARAKLNDIWTGNTND